MVKHSIYLSVFVSPCTSEYQQHTPMVWSFWSAVFCHTNAMVFNILNDAQNCHWMLPSVKLKWQRTCRYIYIYHVESKTCTFNTWYIHVHYIHTCSLITYDMRNPSITLPCHPHNWSSRAIAVDPSTNAGDPGFLLLLCWLSKRNGFCRLETNWFKE